MQWVFIMEFKPEFTGPRVIRGFSTPQTGVMPTEPKNRVLFSAVLNLNR